MMLSITLCAICPALQAHESTPSQESVLQHEHLAQAVIRQQQEIAGYIAQLPISYRTRMPDMYTASHVDASDMSHEDVIAMIHDNYRCVRTIASLYTGGESSDATKVLPVDTNASREQINQAITYVQHLFEHALAYEDTACGSCLTSAYETIQAYPWQIGGGAALAAAALCYVSAYHMNTDEMPSYVSQTSLKKALRGALRVMEATIAWTRYRTPEEINQHGPESIKPYLLTCKDQLERIGFPGNVKKAPVIQSTSRDIPDAQEFKKIAKDHGYQVHEDRVPGDIIDVKIWGCDLLNMALMSDVIKEAETWLPSAE